jgi:acyl-CoA synthetase (NDP forming)/RimJ/RimL family protein N-acetyltransferase
VASSEQLPGTGAYPPSWETDVVLADGHTVHVRPIVPDDAGRLVRFHQRQSPESIYFRYFSPRPELSSRDVAHFTEVDHRDRVAFVALSMDEIIAVARYERYRGTDTAEVAFFVDDEHHGRGLASLLLEYLVAAGQENGLRRFAATTLPNNRKMLKVFQSAGYEVASRLDDGVVEVGFDIDPTGEALAAMVRRERAAEAASVRPMLQPRSVAVVGAGRARGGLGAEVLHNLVANGYRGALHAVNQHAVDGSATGRPGGEIGDVATVRRISELPEPVDLVVIATPAASVPDLVDEAGAHGARSVVVLSAGFAEAGPDGAALQRRAVEAARRHGVRMLGPNCLGLINADPEVRLDATLTPSIPRWGRVGMVAEAGTLAASIVDHAARMDLGVSTMVAAGNRADVTASDLLSYWTEDEHTDAVLLYLAARNVRPRFVRAARAASVQMPVAALHTSLAAAGDGGRGSDAARRAQAMFRQTGIISVGTLEQLFDVGRMVSDQPVPDGRGVAVVGNSDGAVALAAGACVDAGLDLVPVELTTPGGSTVRNPFDLTYTADADAFREVLGAVVADPRVHSVIVVYTPPRLDWNEEVVEVVLDAAASAPTIAFAATMLGAAGRVRLCRDLAEGPGVAVPIFRFPEDAANAIGRLAEYRDWRAAVDVSPPAGAASGDQDAVREPLEAATRRLDASDEPSATVALEHTEQQQLLAAYGLELIDRAVVDDVESAVDAAMAMGWPVALKAAQRNRLTRSTASGVVLDLADPGQLRATWTRMWDALGESMVPAVVQRFVESGLDVSVEVERDPDGSGVVRVGLGGPAAILGEHELGVLPLSLADASSLVASSPVGRVLTDPLDRVPVVEVVHRLAALVEENDEVRRVRADPVLVSPMWARVADVDIEVGEPIDDFDVRRLE